MAKTTAPAQSSRFHRELINEMQLVGWIGTTTIPWLQWMPAWVGTWFSVFPNWETILAQVIALALVLGSYAVSRYQAIQSPKKRGQAPYQRLEAPPVAVPAEASALGQHGENEQT